ncbi:MAG TPA: Hsp20/alpha crystallin family protein [Nocardioides sp.]|uniref:Hsp20/alpha crystallin family protein n=1 Tax=Nocardioides sp. TaxID=35761 RepID=UPI002E2F74C6|nr:Hsp20/alpha crystallin family protein [Nocardioides sp.]HEX5087227.1 Hsp20/alpha crystallin family protein [Nocardioides sp.]
MSLTTQERRPVWPWETWWSQDVVDGAFSDMLRDFFGKGILDRLPDAAHLVRVEEFVDGDTYVIRAEMPGLDPNKDIELTVREGLLHLSAERREHTEDERPDGFRSEFHYGRMTRNLRLPEGTSEADVTATYKDGILEVRLPAPKEAPAPTGTKIPVIRS